MATSVPNLNTIALQFQAATAQLQELSALPESQRESDVKKAVEEIKNKVIALEEHKEEIKSKLEQMKGCQERTPVAPRHHGQSREGGQGPERADTSDAIYTTDRTKGAQR
jgi:hypothetical protein